MNNILKIVLIVLGVLVVAAGLLFAGTLLGSRLNQRAAVPDVSMSRGGNGNPPGSDIGPGNAPQDGRLGDGMRGGNGNPPGHSDGGPGIPRDNRDQATPTPLTADEAKTAAQAYVTGLKIDGLEIGDVQIFDNSAYVAVKETASGNGAFELVVDARSKTAHPSGGASTLWNLKYGGVLHAGMPERRGGPNDPLATPATTSAAPAATPADVSADMPISAEQAVAAAQAFLDKAGNGATAAATPLKFYGYYSLSFSKDGQVVGILSVNGFNGEVLPGMPHDGPMHEPR